MSPEACVALATMSTQGKGGLPKEDKAVASYYTRACGLASMHDVDVDGSNVVAQGCAKAGSASAGGKGVTKDPGRAFEFFTRACDRGDKASCDQAKKIGPPAKK